MTTIPFPVSPLQASDQILSTIRIIMAASNLFNLSLLLSFLVDPKGSILPPESGKSAVINSALPTCSRIECPTHTVIHAGNSFEIRRYDSAVWMSTSPIVDISLVEATRNGFLQLFNYIQGKNNYSQQIEMTAPVITEVSPSDGPVCASSFMVSFYVPKENQMDPPPAKGLHARRWKTTYAAVRQFGGFVADYDVGMEAAALQASLSGTIWSDAIERRRVEDPTAAAYTVAQYNSPFEFKDRVNEIWLLFNMEDDFAV